MENEKDISPGMKIAVLIMLISFLYLFSVTFLPIPESGIELAKIITGFLLGTALGTFIQYYWGNSSKKDQGDNSQKKE
jgi:hypothetical protein